MRGYLEVGISRSTTFWHSWPSHYFFCWSNVGQDFWFYSTQNHPLLILWYTDNDNPFSPYEKFVDFTFSTAVTLLGAALLLIYRDVVEVCTGPSASFLNTAPFSVLCAPATHLFSQDALVDYSWALQKFLSTIVSCIFVSIPVMCMRIVSFYALGCPCLLTDASSLDAVGQRRHALYSRLEVHTVTNLLAICCSCNSYHAFYFRIRCTRRTAWWLCRLLFSLLLC